MVPIGWHQQALRNFAFRFADALVFQTEDARSYFPKYVQNRGVIIPNPINGKLPSPIEGGTRKDNRYSLSFASAKEFAYDDQCL